jgi:hypothetical protein
MLFGNVDFWHARDNNGFQETLKQGEGDLRSKATALI